MISAGTTDELNELGKSLEELYGKFKVARELRANLREMITSGHDGITAFNTRTETLKQDILGLLAQSLTALPDGFTKATTQNDPLHKGLAWLAPKNRESKMDILSKYFTTMDILLFPLEYSARLVMRDEIDFYLVDPGVRLGLSDLPPDSKLCGDAYSKFGGFFREPWRRNDIFWGRMDGSARLIEILLGDPDEWIPKERALAPIRAYLGLGCSEDPPDRYGQYLQDYANAEDTLAQWNPTTKQEEKKCVHREVLNLLVLRHHLELLERKLPQLLRAELDESARWGVDSRARQVLNKYFPEQSVEVSLASLPAQPLHIFRAIHKELEFGRQDLGAIPTRISLARLATAIRNAARAIAHSLPDRPKNPWATGLIKIVDKAVPPALPLIWKLEKLRRRIFGKKSEKETKAPG